ncbi:hypothetical protein ACFLRC_01975 [Candidatus Altiarchaeota archaeon]
MKPLDTICLTLTVCILVFSMGCILGSQDEKESYSDLSDEEFLEAYNNVYPLIEDCVANFSEINGEWSSIIDRGYSKRDCEKIRQIQDEFWNLTSVCNESIEDYRKLTENNKDRIQKDIDKFEKHKQIQRSISRMRVFNSTTKPVVKICRSVNL